MPEFVLGRNYTLASTKGHMINFIKGRPQHVPPELINEAIAIGATPVDGKEYDPLGPEATEPVELTLDERKELLFEAYKELEMRNTRGDFNAQGLPNVKVLEKLVGFVPLAAERNETWQAYRETKENADT